MNGGTVYSQRLGAIRDEQFDAVAARFNLGRFLKAEPVTSGLFGQNVFVTTSEGEFVLRGAPHWVRPKGETDWRRDDRWQFTKEKFFAQQLRERTRAPVPWPMLHDETSDILGWPYLVMPRMPGQCFDDRSIMNSLSADDRRGVAVALGEMLAEMQTLTSPFAGDFDQSSILLQPAPGGAIGMMMAETAAMLSEGIHNSIISSRDIEWIEEHAGQAQSAAVGRTNTYVHCDFKFNNLTLTKSAGAWRVTGLFDLHEARFADGALDIVRQACAYLDFDPEQAQPFVQSYLGRVAADTRVAQLMPYFVINDRLKLWSYFARPDVRASWTLGKDFRGWADRYMDAIHALL